MNDGDVHAVSVVMKDFNTDCLINYKNIIVIKKESPLDGDVDKENRKHLVEKIKNKK